MSNNPKYNKSKILIQASGIILIVATTVLWTVSHILNWGWNWGFTEPSIVVFALMGIALLLFPYLAEFSLPGGIAFKLRGEIEELQDIQLTGEVVFNKEEKGDRHLYWVDEEGKKRLLPNMDTASLFATQKGFVGISKDRFDKLEGGSDIPSLSKESFRRTEEFNMFAILDGKIFYLSSLSLPFKYGWLSKLKDMGRITDEDFRKYRIFR